MSNTKVYLTKDSILAVKDVACNEVYIPEWNGTVRIKEMSGAERDEFEYYITSRSKNNQVDLRGTRVKLLSLCLVDDKGKRLFSESELSALGEKSAKVLNSLFETAQNLNGIGNASEKVLSGN